MIESESKPALASKLIAPPRPVPLLMRLHVLFGGVDNQLGWLFFGFGMCFFWAFGFYADISSMVLFRGELVQTQGVINNSINTGYVSGGSRRSRGRQIHEHHYSFTADDGKQYQGVSYEEINGSRAGYPALIEYRKNNPTISRVYGTRKNILPPAAILSAIFPLIGALFIIHGLKRGLKVDRLLRNGQLTLGKLIAKNMTSTRINRRMVYKMTFEFTLPDQRKYRVTTSTHQTELLEDEVAERLLYDPANPETATMLDDLPGGPIIDQLGNFQNRNNNRSLAVLILPGISIVLHGLILIKKLL